MSDWKMRPPRLASCVKCAGTGERWLSTCWLCFPSRVVDGIESGGFVCDELFCCLVSITDDKRPLIGQRRIRAHMHVHNNTCSTVLPANGSTKQMKACLVGRYPLESSMPAYKYRNLSLRRASDRLCQLFCIRQLVCAIARFPNTNTTQMSPYTQS